jgi:hypothetical protein
MSHVEQRDKIQELRYQIAVLLCSPIEYIIPDGVEPTDSVYVTFMIPEWCIDVLMKIQPEDKARLNSFGVDRYKVGNVVGFTTTYAISAYHP